MRSGHSLHFQDALASSSEPSGALSPQGPNLQKMYGQRPSDQWSKQGGCSQCMSWRTGGGLVWGPAQGLSCSPFVPGVCGCACNFTCHSVF